MAERQEEFGISFLSSDKSIAVIEGPSSITVLIEDDDGKQPVILSLLNPHRQTYYTKQKVAEGTIF